MKGFTLTEVLISLSILIVIFTLTVPRISDQYTERVLDNSAEKVIETLKSAQSRAMSSVKDDNWGVRFNSVDNHGLLLFKGAEFSERDIDFDIIHNFPGFIKFEEIDLEQGGREVVFSKITGISLNNGKIILYDDQGDKSHKICIEDYLIFYCKD